MATRPARASSAAALADSEYAFQLQVQESVRASLRSVSRPPPPSPAKPDVSAARSTRESNDQKPNIRLVKRPKQDVDRQIPDQKLAADMAGASSSHSSRVSEYFRVYTKGLLSEEYIREAKVPVVGIGVAVCDSKGNVILEIENPKIDGSVAVSELEAEIQAVVQGLKSRLRSGRA